MRKGTRQGKGRHHLLVKKGNHLIIWGKAPAAKRALASPFFEKMKTERSAIKPAQKGKLARPKTRHLKYNSVLRGNKTLFKELSLPRYLNIRKNHGKNSRQRWHSP
ncbi:MAG: hypothetical protein KIS77_19110 [Saprospiraceae bacterium]|nr:hypothetical protein [Saprospiraceae bacterium]